MYETSENIVDAALKRAMAAMIVKENENEKDSVTVLSYEEDTISTGFCETCYYEEVVVKIDYTVAGFEGTNTYTYYGYFSELIRELTETTEEN